MLNFLLPNIFVNWEQFESWFDFSDLQDEEGTEEFLQDRMKQELVKKIHLILQPLLLRRIKADVEHLLPKKREYILYAPMTKQQTDLYNIISKKTADTRNYLVELVMTQLKKNFTPKRIPQVNLVDSNDANSRIEDVPSPKLNRYERGRFSNNKKSKNAFEKMMSSQIFKANEITNKKRKAQEPILVRQAKANKPHNFSTPSASLTRRKTRKQVTYFEAKSSDDDALSDGEFEAKLAEEMATIEETLSIEQDQEESEVSKVTEIASECY